MSLNDFWLSIIASLIAGIILLIFSIKNIIKYKQKQSFTSNSKQSIIIEGKGNKNIEENIEQTQRVSKDSEQEIRKI